MRDFKVYQASGYLTKLVTDASDVRKEYEEISGSLVQFNTPMSAPLEILRVDINPVQSGSGDPSPDNVRPITGWAGCEVWVKDEYDTTLPATASVTFPDTVYGGEYEFVSGSGNSRFAEYIFTGNESWFEASTPNRFGLNLSFLPLNIAQQPMVPNAKQNVYSSIFGQFIYKNADNVAYIYVSTSSTNIAINTPLASTAQEIAQLFAGTQLVYELATPIEIQLTPQEISTLIGVNNIWADTGDVSVKYRTH